MRPGNPLDYDDNQWSISDLWEPVSREIAVTQEGDSRDYYHDYLRSLKTEEVIFCQVPRQSPSATELLVEGEEEGDDMPDGGSTLNAIRETQIPDVECPTYPWLSRGAFLTHLLLSGSARIKYSEIRKKSILAWGKALGARNVPLLGALRTMQSEIEEMVSTTTEKVVSSSGTVFYINEVANAIANDFSNSITRLPMADYLEDGGREMSEMKNGRKWLVEVPHDMLTITVRVRGKLYFVGELLRCQNGRFFIPDRFFMRKVVQEQGDQEDSTSTKLCALGNDVQKTENGFVVSPQLVIICTDGFTDTYKDILLSGDLECGFTGCSQSFAAAMPHPRREQARGRMVYGVPLIIFLDDVSTNISKQWNKHHAIYMSNGLLPRAMVEKEFCTRFVTSSPHATPMELVRALKESIAAAEHGVETYDCKYKEECLLVPHAHFWGSNNPMQAEECSHGGLRCNYFCRECEVGGTQAYKRSDEGFLSLFRPGIPRTPEKTTGHINELLRLSTLSGAQTKIKNYKEATGVSNSTSGAAMQAIVDLGKTLYDKANLESMGMKKEDVERQLQDEVARAVQGNGINPLIGMPGVDMHQDTLTEILHTILLGVVKYFWG
ncbi:hypothetical protein V5O48_006330 [Marasmius crinis-equi]|uniref:Uncharacterized protein n=1 Tax=Marasmius crinis-equi TaxID=585013 RepID=A0ABR3FKP9_9AGAR